MMTPEQFPAWLFGFLYGKGELNRDEIVIVRNMALRLIEQTGDE